MKFEVNINVLSFSLFFSTVEFEGLNNCFSQWYYGIVIGEMAHDVLVHLYL